MKLIVGLGNPGIIYARSRHNIGFFSVKALAKAYKIPLKRDRLTCSLTGKGKIENENVILACPLTFMNLSGSAVAALIKKYKIDLEDLFVVCDDLDLEFGRLKVRASGSSGGHRGLHSIIEALGRENFARLGVGIGRPKGNTGAAKYVLSPFAKKERTQLSGILERILECVGVWLAEGINKGMNLFNRR